MDGFPAAPWPTVLKATSFVATVVLVGVSALLVTNLPRGTSVAFAAALGIAVAFLPLLIALGAAFFVVAAYELDATELRVRRLLWSTRIPLSRLTHAWGDANAMKRSLRLFGNGGLYSITGLYRNRALGRYRAFVTDPRRAVVLRLADRTVVISPSDPPFFLEQLHVLFPAVGGADDAARNGHETPRGRSSSRRLRS